MGHKLHRSKFRRIRWQRPLRLEPLEDRRVLATFTVTNLLDSGPGSLRQSILDANSNPGPDDIVWQTSLSGAITLTSGELQITDDVTITGLGTDQTTIYAAGNSRAFYLANVRAVIEMLTLLGGESPERGGAIFSSGSDLELNQVTITGSAATSGGAIATEYYGALTVRNSTITGNTAAERGGGIWGDNSRVEVIDSTISQNTSTVSGGGLNTQNSVPLGGYSLRISDTEIMDNATTGDGGGIFSQFMGLRVTRSKISENSAGAAGGGVWASDYPDGGGAVTLTETTLDGNLATGRGGGAYLYAGWGEEVCYGAYCYPAGGVRLLSTTVSGNSSMSQGGGVFLKAPSIESRATIDNSTFSGNSAVNGGGAYLVPGRPASVRLSQSTIADNQAAADGDGLFVGTGYVSYPNSVVLENAIVAGNGAGTDNIRGSLEANFSLIEASLFGTITGSNNISLDPRLGPLGDNGGPTLTHALGSGSPAVDAGNPAFVPPPDVDQRGAPRVVDGDLDGTAVIDMGAVERQPLSLVVDTTVDLADSVPGDGSCDIGTGECSLRAAVMEANAWPGPDEIVFASGWNATIELTGGRLEITDAVRIDGPGADRLTIDAGNRSGIFDVSANQMDVSLSGMTLTGGRRAIANFGGNLTVTNATISGNTTTSRGGGIWNSRGNLTIHNSTIRGNSADRGGGIYSYNSYLYDVTVTNSTINGNTASDSGGGIDSYRSNVFVTNSTISGNSAGRDGGGIHGSISSLNVKHSTLTGNVANSSGGGISQIGTGFLTLRHSMVSGNTATRFTEIERSGTIFPGNVVYFNLFGENSTSTADAVRFSGGGYYGNNITATSDGSQPTALTDILNTSLAHNGGSTLTHALAAGSPARNAGDPTAMAGVGSVPPFDQRGTPFTRVYDGRIDIGSLESQPVTVDGDFNDDGLYDCLDIDALVGAIAAGTNGLAFDLTSDGLVDLADRDAWLAAAGEFNLGPGKVYLLGDANLNGIVDGSDFGVWNANKFSTLTVIPGWCSGNFNADALVDGSDFGIWNANKFTASIVLESSTSSPFPGTMQPTSSSRGDFCRRSCPAENPR